ncbi:MAG: TIGR03621 family F420-dependent LLM class oxidoreductase [Candidatus Limnocylindrales bacterium]|jgi:probable F420-dependent oxidoreductase
MHAFRFAVQQTMAPSGDRWTALARRAESIGYDVLVMPDHLGRQLSPLAALAAAASATTRLRIGAFVFDNDYRHPLILAREAATLDLLSGGRFELGLGAGWMTGDYRRLGMTYDPGPRRVDRLEEAIPLVKRLLTGETVSHRGEHYWLDRASVGVETVQKPRPPLAIGGGGPRMLRLAGREADIVGLVPGFSAHGRVLVRQATESATTEKVALIREAAGDRFERLELNLWLGDAGLVGSGNSLFGSVAAAARWAPTALYGSPYVLYGTLSSVREKLLRRRERLGISYYTIPSHAMESMAPLVEALAGR